LKEVIALVKAHWAGDELHCHGEFVNVSGYSGLPRPVQRPHPPIMIGGSRRRVLSLAAREADIVSLANVPWVPRNDAGLTPHQEAVHRVGVVREAAGERFGDLEIESSPYFSRVTERPDEALLALGAQMRGADPDVLRYHPNVLVGTVEEIAERLQARRETIGVNYVTIPQELIDSFAPVCARLTGT
jgi:alkanesulfonate monooxygenase SsuD/methylene tetrahydromethanopterin reductase-like flavin-dependent oxidoreductase (luciferase family)